MRKDMALSVKVFMILLLYKSVSGSFSKIGRYEELQWLGNPCYPRDTCQSLHETTEDHLWGNRTCECGEHCVPHKTCCVDSNYFEMNQFAPKHSENACQKVHTRDFMVNMVSSCLQEWQGSYMYEQCVRPENELEDPLSQVPATSTTTMTTYRNFFCAFCNNDANSTVLWDIGVSIKGRYSMRSSDEIIKKLEFSSEYNSWGYFHVDPQTRKKQFQKIQIKFSVREDLKKFVKPCHPKIISKCSPSYKSTRLRHKCEAYYSPIRGQKRGLYEFFRYRNIHCALCNGLRANIDEFSCHVKDNIRKGVPLSFTKLLDINRRDGDIVGVTSVCRYGEVFDPFFKKCRSLVCALPGYVKSRGGCVKSD